MPPTVRALALALPQAVEADHHGFPSFRVGGRIFATLPDATHLHLMLPEPEIHAQAAAHADCCELYWWGQRVGALRVDLDRADAALIAGLLTAAWRAKAPKRLAAAHPGA